MHRLEKIEIAGFKSIKKQSFNLGAINLLIGANGSGKSNFIEAFAFLGAITEGRLDSYVGKSGGAERILHFGSKVTDKIKFHAFFNDSVDQYKIELEPSELDKLYPSYEVAYYWLKANYAQPYSTVLSGDGIEANISKKSQSGVKSYVKQALESWRVYHFHDTGPSSPMKKVADIDDNRFLRTDGSNLAAFLYFLKLKAPDEYGLLTKTIRKIAPFFGSFVLSSHHSLHMGYDEPKSLS